MSGKKFPGINEFFEKSPDFFLQEFSRFQTTTQIVTKTFATADPSFTIDTPTKCFKWSIMAQMPTVTAGFELLEVVVNSTPLFLKVNSITNAAAPYFEQVFDGQPYVERSDDITIKNLVGVTFIIKFHLLILSDT